MIEKSLASLVLVIAILAVHQPTVQSQEQEDGFLLIGYGGEKFLPFLDGARYRFVVGEGLVLKAIGHDVSVILTTNWGEEHAFHVGAGEAVEIWRFRGEDVGTAALTVIGGGRATIEVLSLEESALGWIDFQPAGFMPADSDGQEVLEARIVGSTLSGFAITGEGGGARKIFIRPNSTLHLQIPPNALSVKIALRHYDSIELSGYSGRLHILYRAEPIVAEYRFEGTGEDLPMRVVDVYIPPLGETGENGLVPLRYGTLVVNLVYTGRGGGRFEQSFEVTVSPIAEEPPPVSSSTTIVLRDLLRNGLEVVTANLTTGRFERRIIRVPDYRVRVYDSHLRVWVEDYSISLPGYLSLRNGSESVIIPKTISIIEGGYTPIISVRPSLKVYSVDVSESIGPLTLEAGKPVTIYVDGRLVEVEVRHAAGFIIQDSQIYINDSLRGVGGRLSLRLPGGIYNFSAETPFGKVYSTVDVRDVAHVVLVVRGYTAETLALITVFLIQLSIFAIYFWRWYRRVRLRGGGASGVEAPYKK
ncbi:hypothetical protein HRbin02_01449 [Candidatus Calditenuaceae archaeon HR02]|nr:hypothetical protein HRbin02_01449 [Candidatus Calditenuaceae archaeon HR02]